MVLPSFLPQIVPFTMDLYDQVFHLWQNCQGIGLSEADSKENIASYLTRNPHMSYVALVNGELAGALLAGHDGRRGYLHHLAVAEKYRGLGLAKALVTTSLAALTHEGIGKCHLFVIGANTSGKNFWQHLGWTVREDIGIISRNLP